MKLACRTPHPLQKVGVQFCFFKDGSALGLRWTHSPELRIPALTRKDSGSYWCEARAAAPKAVRSGRVRIDVRSECPGLRWWLRGVGLGCAGRSVRLPGNRS